MFKRSAGVKYRENRVCSFDKTRGEKRMEPVPDLCKSGSNEQDIEWLAYSSVPNICHTE